MLATILFGIIFALVSGCTTYAVVDNKSGVKSSASVSYSVREWRRDSQTKTNETAIMLAFSGGGTRAAALSYGVLEELHETQVEINGRSVRLLNEVDRISSVSGGSFTAAYYGIYGDKIFTDFEEAFLRRDVEGALIKGLFNPLLWFSSKGRTEMAIDYYEEHLFHGATFKDMMHPDRPQILINATDLAHGVRFSFVQEYFNLLCSDLSSYPVARAVTASSAVPILFHPVVLKNYTGCEVHKTDWLIAAEKKTASYPQLALTMAGLASYLDKDQRKYIHLVDGGITDNLGLRALYDLVGTFGGVKQMFKVLDRPPPRRLVLISVNAETDPEPEMDKSSMSPPVEDIMGAVTHVQLSRYNAATLELMDQKLTDWAKQLSTPERPVTAYFIKLSFKDIQKPMNRVFFNQLPTTFSLSDEQVDRLIEAGHELLHNNSEYHRLITDLMGS